jgi:hypothetical protein
MKENWQGTIYGEVQESHLWAYASWMTEDLEGDDTVIVPLKRWAERIFGKDAPLDDLAAVFRPAGSILTEALYVGFEPFGDTRQSVPIVRTTGGTRSWKEEPVKPAVPYSDYEAEAASGTLHLLPI